jgi:hypothetical protein
VSGELIAKREDLEVQRAYGTDEDHVWLTRPAMAEGDEITLTADELRWLITTAGPAALHAIGAAPQIRKRGPDAEGPEGS